jgi:hypothetical protein
MASIWERVLSRVRENDTFYTVRDHKRFTVKIESDDMLCVTTSKGAEHPIYRKDFRKAEIAQLIKVGIKPKDLSTAGVGKGFSYIAGIISTVAQQDM